MFPEEFPSRYRVRNGDGRDGTPVPFQISLIDANDSRPVPSSRRESRPVFPLKALAFHCHRWAIHTYIVYYVDKLCKTLQGINGCMYGHHF